MASISLEIPQDLLDTTHLSLSQIRQELALTLYAQNLLSIGKAHEFAALSLWEFRQRLAIRKIPVHYGKEDLNDDLATIKYIRDASE